MDRGDVGGSDDLYIAAERGRDKLVSLLLSEGFADADVGDHWNQTALMRSLLEEESEGRLLSTETLLHYGADVRLRCKSGDTALHYAVRRSPDRLEMLLSHGADPNAANKKGETVLATWLHNVDIRSLSEEDVRKLELLLRYGANPNINTIGRNPVTFVDRLMEYEEGRLFKAAHPEFFTGCGTLTE